MAEVDYHTECGGMVPLSFIQMWAATLFGYHDIAGVIHYRFNALGHTGNCTEISNLLTCDTSHIDSERQLVENVFALDDCSLLAMKFFSNDDTHWTDYANCGEYPQSFIQMLARCIVTHASVNRINCKTYTDTCNSIDDLYHCSPFSLTDDVAELLLVGNVFAKDDCGFLLIKLFADTSTMTDYHTPCDQLPQSFMQLLARCIIKYGGKYFLNIAAVSAECDDMHAFWTCDNNNVTPERALVENLFATDSCGHLAVKMFTNGGKRQ